MATKAANVNARIQQEVKQQHICKTLGIILLAPFSSREQLKGWGSYGFRKIMVKNYYIYFWINEEKRQLQIIAVIYAKMDQVGQLEKMVLEGEE